MSTASVGVLAKLGLGASNPVDQPLEFQQETVKKVGQILETGGIRGTRSHASERTREGPYKITGQIVCQPSPVELDYLLYKVCGTAKTGGNVFALAETIPEFYYTADRVAKVITYAGCKAVKTTFAASAGGLLTVTVDVEGKTETIGAAGSFPSLTLDTGAPYALHDTTGAVVIGGTAYEVNNLEIVIENVFNGDRFNNSISRTDIPIIDRNVTLKMTLPYTSTETGLYDAGASGAACTITFTNGNYSLLFSFAAIQYAADTPTVGGKDEIPLTLTCVARKSGSTAELIITNDSTN